MHKSNLDHILFQLKYTGKRWISILIMTGWISYYIASFVYFRYVVVLNTSSGFEFIHSMYDNSSVEIQGHPLALSL